MRPYFTVLVSHKTALTVCLWVNTYYTENERLGYTYPTNTDGWLRVQRDSRPRFNSWKTTASLLSWVG